MAFPFLPPFVLAPMEGVTSEPIRTLVSEYGPLGLVCTEFVRVSGEKVSERHLERQVRKPPGVALSVQLMGNDARLMADAARIIAAAGADVVDVNLGCPSKTAARKGVGAALLRDPVELGALVTTLRAAVPGLFSAKLRAGFDSSDAALDNARIVERAGADFLTVHPRRRVDLYRGVADWRIIAVLRQELSIPVVGNGDVWYAADALRMLVETGCAAVMIGRPALRNPWIFRQIDDLLQGREPFAPSGADVAAHLLRVHERLVASFDGPKERLAGPLKEHLGFVCRAVPDGGAFGRRLLRLKTPALLLEAAEEALSALPPEALDLDARGRYGLEQAGSVRAAAAA
jgi:nifR3 family TIM-barrel protein